MATWPRLSAVGSVRGVCALGKCNEVLQHKTLVVIPQELFVQYIVVG